MRYIIFVYLLSISVFASSEDYICQYQGIYQTNSLYKLDEVEGSSMIGQTFSLNRESGQLTNAKFSHWLYKDSEPTVISIGDENSSYTILYRAPAALGGVHTALLKIEAYSKTQNKQFVVSGGGVLYTGYCH